MKIRCTYDKLIPLSELKPHPKNRNDHPDDQIARLAQILEYQGWRYPVKVSLLSGYVTSGHGRIEAAKKNGWTEVPVNFQEYESEEQEYADLIADNSIASWSELDLSAINTDIGDLGPDFDIDLLGLKDFEIEVADKYADKDADEVPEIKESFVKPGDVWILGQHRLMCGDSTQITDVEKLMAGENVDITFTSPPYNLGENAKLRGYNGDGKDSAYIRKTDNKTPEEYLNFLNDFTSLSIQFSKYSFINIQLLAGNKFVISDYWGRFKNHLCDLMIWDKEHAAPQMAARVLNSVFEFIFIFSHDEFPSRAINSGKDFRGTIQNIYRLNPVGKKDPLAKDHGAVFPVQFCEFFISQFSDDSVYDPFGGSGTTLIACEKTNRKCFMMELDTHYCGVIIERWQKFTGQKAYRELDKEEYPNG